MTARAALPNYALAIRRALTKAHDVCMALGLLDGPRSYQKQTGGLIIRCPAHSEHHPSCSVRVAKDGTIAVRCHACGFSGDVLTLIAQARGLSTRRDFRYVLMDGAELAGLWGVVDELRGREPRPIAKSPAPHLPPAPPPAPTLDAETFARIASRLLAACPLRAQPDVYDYLDVRRIAADAEARGFGALPPPREQRPLVDELTETYGAEALALAGLTHPERPGFLWCAAHRLVIPWRSPDGSVASLQRRIVGASSASAPLGDTSKNGNDGALASKKTRAVPKYMFPRGRPMPPHPFDIENVAAAMEFFDLGRRDPEIAFVEGALDVLAMHALNRKRERPKARLVVGLPSATRWMAPWAELARGRVALVALDEDRAGAARVDEIARDLYAAGAIAVKRAKPPRGKDWGEVLEKTG